MFDFIVKMAIVIFGCGFLMFLGAFIYDHYWFKFVSKDTKKLERRRVFEAREKTLQRYYEENPHEDPKKYNR